MSKAIALVILLASNSIFAKQFKVELQKYGVEKSPVQKTIGTKDNIEDLFKEEFQNNSYSVNNYIESNIKNRPQVDDKYIEILSRLGQGKEGGDLVTCSDGRKYFLDYLIATSENKNSEYFNEPEELITALSYKLPGLSAKFYDIYSSFKLEQRINNYRWINMPVVEVDDENLAVNISEICGGKLSQAIVRMRRGDLRKFYFNKDDFENIQRQFSWAILHELLWDYFDDAHTIRVANEFLHNKNSYSLSSDIFHFELQNRVGDVRFLTYEESNSLLEIRKFYIYADEVENFSLKDKSDLIKFSMLLYSFAKYEYSIEEVNQDISRIKFLYSDLFDRKLKRALSGPSL